MKKSRIKFNLKTPQMVSLIQNCSNTQKKRILDRILSMSKVSYHQRYSFLKIAGLLTTQPFSVWRTKTGWHCCKKEYRKSELSQFGPAVVLYFQFLKLLIIMAIIGTVLSLPAYFLYFSGNSKDLGDVKSFFNAFTLGNLGYCNIINY